LKENFFSLKLKNKIRKESQMSGGQQKEGRQND